MGNIVESRRLGLEEVNQRFETFEDLVADVRDKIAKAGNVVLKANWFIGLQAWIIQQGAVYGDRSINEFAEGIGMAQSSVYEAKRFYETFSREDLEHRLVANNIPYRKALTLTRCNDGDQRLLIEQASYDLELSDEEMNALVKEANAGKAIPTGAEEVRGLLDVLSDPDRHLPVVDDTDGPTDKEVSNALADPNDERAYLKNIKATASGISKAVKDLSEKAVVLRNSLVNLGALTEDNYVNAEKRLMDTHIDIRKGMEALYHLQKALTDSNIVNRNV